MGAVYYIERRRDGLDHRVFRETQNGSLEWAHFKDWINDWDAARYYGFSPRNLPENCERIEL